MARHAFHLTPHASGPLYQFISSPTLRIIQLCLILFAIFFFSVGLGLASKSIPPAPYWDLGVNNDFCDKLALGVAFLPVLWLGFLLLWHVLRKPKIHPGYYISFDLYLGLSYLSAMPVLFIFSAYFLAADQVCSSSPCQGLVSAIRGLYVRQILELLMPTSSEAST